MLPTSDSIGLLDNTRPSTSCGTGYDLPPWSIRRYNLKFGSVTSIENSTMVDDFRIRIYRRQIPPDQSRVRTIAWNLTRNYLVTS
jgi:hypothetical protein